MPRGNAKRFPRLPSGVAERLSCDPARLRRRMRNLIKDLTQTAQMPRHLTSGVPDASTCRQLHAEAMRRLEKVRDETDRVGTVRSDGPTVREITRILLTIISAWTNPAVVDLDIDRQARRAKKTVTGKRMVKVKMKAAAVRPYAALGAISAPSVIVDQFGRIVVWHLPESLSKPRQLQILSAIRAPGFQRLLAESLPTKKTRKTDAEGKDTICWREKGYLADDDADELGRGTVNLSSGWYAQGHEMWADKIYPRLGKGAAAGGAFLTSTAASQVLANIVMAAVSPSCFDAGATVANRLQAGTRLYAEPHAYPAPWKTVFNGMAVIVNRVTAAHRDNKGAPHSYDLLMNLGSAHQAKLVLEDLGAELDYGPGTLVALTGKVLTHEVPYWGKEERACIAHFMVDRVHERLGVKQSVWSTHKDIMSGL